MKYWLYDRSQKKSLGPFTPQELKKLPNFGPKSMVAPEQAKTSGEWKKVKAVPDLREMLQPAVSTPPPPPDDDPTEARQEGPSVIASLGQEPSKRVWWVTLLWYLGTIVGAIGMFFVVIVAIVMLGSSRPTVVDKKFLARQTSSQKNAPSEAASHKKALTAVNEWDKFRRAEEKFKGTVTTWEFRLYTMRTVKYYGIVPAMNYSKLVAEGNLSAEIGEMSPSRTVYVFKGSLPTFPAMKEGDVIRVTGKYGGHTDENVARISATKIQKVGYRGKVYK